MHSTIGWNGIKKLGWVAIAAVFCMSPSLATAEHDDHDPRPRSRSYRAPDRTHHDAGPHARVRRAVRIDERLDRYGARENRRLDFMAAIAADFGDFELAAIFDERGDRIQARYDRTGDRIVRRRIAAVHRHDAGCGHAPAVRRGHHGPPRAKIHGHRGGHRYGHRHGHARAAAYHGHRPAHPHARGPRHHRSHWDD